MVFSGIVEEIGTVVSTTGAIGEGCTLRITANVVLGGAYEGCSIAVNGTCLTVTAFDTTSFTVGLAPETLRRTNLGSVTANSRVNLERSLPADGRNSGHFVQGHVDEAGTILETWKEGDSLWMRVGVTPATLRLIVPKGYVAVDGTSLTVCEVDAVSSSFTFMLIAYTQAHVILPGKAVGDAVNIEADITGKYVARSLEGVHAALDALDAKLNGAMLAITARLDALEARQ